MQQGSIAVVRKGDFHFYSLMLSSCLASLSVCLCVCKFIGIYLFIVYLYISLIVVCCSYCMYVIEAMNDNLINVCPLL